MLKIFSIQKLLKKLLLYCLSQWIQAKEPRQLIVFWFSPQYNSSNVRRNFSDLLITFPEEKNIRAWVINNKSEFFNRCSRKWQYSGFRTREIKALKRHPEIHNYINRRASLLYAGIDAKNRKLFHQLRKKNHV